jgi:hypothetical protein
MPKEEEALRKRAFSFFRHVSAMASEMQQMQRHFSAEDARTYLENNPDSY